jgi:hypothetical protein
MSGGDCFDVQIDGAGATRVNSTSFSWRDAGLGASVTFAAGLLLAAAAVITRRRRHLAGG